MIKDCLAIIPARGGSKRIPRKNILSFCGQPIIKYSIDVAISSGCFDEIMVSTEDKEISKIAQNFGAKIPFYRSGKTSDDHAMLADVIEEVLLKYKNRNEGFKYFCCILPTAPFINAKRLREGFELLLKSGADSVLPVVRFSYPIQRALKVEYGLINMFWPENYNVRSQDLMPAYHDSGQFYWMLVDSFLEQKKLLAKNTVPLIISELEVQDIDSIEDWKIAEAKYKILNKQI